MANSTQIAKAYSIRPLFTAALVLAITFTLSCSSDNNNNGGNPSSPSSSSSSVSCYWLDNFDPCIGGTVTIGTQVWQKCNSDAVPSKGVYKCHYCNKYGNLYDWEAANSVCPSGFHLPTEEDWKALTAYIEGDKNCTLCDAKHLKAKCSWMNSAGNGLDSYGFSALPGGFAYSDGTVHEYGLFGGWWSASEYDSNSAYIQVMDCYYSSPNTNWNSESKDNLFSVRCVKDQ